MIPDYPAAQPNNGCFVCGRENPRGLQIRFSPDGVGRVSALWNTSTAWEGFRGVIHGGIVSTVLDEAMSKAVASSGWPALTCELRVRFRHRVASGECLQLRGWVTEKRKKRILAEACLDDQNGNERAHAWAVFLVVSPAGAGTVPESGASSVPC
jgi:acyl-coenzyme A thioesterase PaaI-like protein